MPRSMRLDRVLRIVGKVDRGSSEKRLQRRFADDPAIHPRGDPLHFPLRLKVEIIGFKYNN